MVSAAQVWEWLGQVPDPEIPALSLVDLGVIREVQFEGDTLVVAVTPTYSGCLRDSRSSISTSRPPAMARPWRRRPCGWSAACRRRGRRTG